MAEPNDTTEQTKAPDNPDGWVKIINAAGEWLIRILTLIFAAAGWHTSSNAYQVGKQNETAIASHASKLDAVAANVGAAPHK